MCHVLGRAKAFDRVCIDKGVFLRIRYALLITFGKYRLRGYTVCPDTVRANLGSHVLRKDLNGSLGGGCEIARRIPL